MAIRDLNSWVAELREHRDSLRAELDRVDAALVALDGSASAPPRNARNTRSADTMLDTVVEVFKENEGVELDAAGILAELTERGVTLEAQEPINSVRTALTRLRDRKVIENVRRGVYRYGAAQDPGPAEPPLMLESTPAREIYLAEPSF
jgi:hypothetical protein